MNVFDLLLQANGLVLAVVLLLMLVSIMSWVIIFTKMRLLKKTKFLNDEFDNEFKYASDLRTLSNEFIKRDERHPKKIGPMMRVFVQGYLKYRELRDVQMITDPAMLTKGARIAMQDRLQQELDSLENDLSILGSVGSVSPYVGLFGTVWGIMHAFAGLYGQPQLATLEKVAPGISEALVTTAIGLLAAIPAVLAFNSFSRKIDQISHKMESKIENICSVIERPQSKSPTSLTK